MSKFLLLFLCKRLWASLSLDARGVSVDIAAPGVFTVTSFLHGHGGLAWLR